MLDSRDKLIRLSQAAKTSNIPGLSEQIDEVLKALDQRIEYKEEVVIPVKYSIFFIKITITIRVGILAWVDFSRGTQGVKIEYVKVA